VLPSAPEWRAVRLCVHGACVMCWRHPIDPPPGRAQTCLAVRRFASVAVRRRLRRSTRYRDRRETAGPVLTGPSGAGDTGNHARVSQLRRFFSALAAENFAALLAAMLIASPVDGLRPCRAAR
jgi:hypothetical protein